jgi:hypothetical protein
VFVRESVMVNEKTTTECWTLHGAPIEQVPSSLEAAIQERAKLLDSKRNIETQFANFSVERDGKRLSQEEYNDWRQRALVVHRLTESRCRFLKQWIRNEQQGERPPPTVWDVPVTRQARDLAKRIGYIESIAMQAVAFVRNPTEENRQALDSKVKENIERAGL